MAKPTLKEFKEICEAKAGNVTNIAKACGVERKSIYNWMNGNAKWKQAFEDVKESLLDFTESQQMLLIRGLMKKDDEGKFIGWIERPSEAMIIWYQKTQGKHRGFTERIEQEVTLKGNVPVKKWLEESRKQRAEKKKAKK